MNKLLSPSVGFSSKLDCTTDSDATEKAPISNSGTYDAPALTSSFKYFPILPFYVIVVVFSTDILISFLCVETTLCISIVTVEAWTKRIIHGLITPTLDLIYTII